ncbi:tetratricopeptide repeat protein [Pseudanabaena sp. PCC 6802]|uniref:tetratricopeptide repeat protein n=1 Tax=Pseudanabaena sp. PCC 6802 TaxID=118173 RepID=UPI000344BB89|nr:tetratricopeptide repeat protein [Pseudanabaena sp. PCC 6802]
MNKQALENAKLASNYHQQGQLQAAIAHYQKAIAFQHDFVAAHWNLGSILQEQGDPEAGLSHQLQALEIKPDLLNPQQHYQMGRGFMQSGKLDAAIACYQRALRQKPDYIEVLAALGTIYGRQGNLDLSVQYWQQLIAINPALAEAHYNLGITFCRQERFEAAIAAFQRAIHLQPDLDAAHFSLGDVFLQIGNLDVAIAHLETTIDLQPNCAQAYNSLGLALSRKLQVEQAVAMYERAIAIAPDLAQAHCNLADVLLQQEKLDEAIAACRQAIALKPDLAAAYSNLGVALMRQGQLEEAIAACSEAIKLQPNLAAAHSNLGEVLFKQDRLDEAIAAYEKAIALDPNLGDAHCNLGVALCELNRIDAALKHLHKAVSLQPDDAISHVNLGMTQILIGDFANGLVEYEWRWQQKDVPSPKFTQPLWDGSELAGKTILLWAEQGLGDTLQFIRYAPSIAQKGGRVIASCPVTLVRLVASVPGVEMAIAEGEPLPAFDVHAQMLSLPRLLDTTVSNIPSIPVPYIPADLWQHKDISRESLCDRALNVGIVWASGYRQREDSLRFYHKKSCPLSLMIQLLELPHVHLYSLQVGRNANDLDGLGEFSDRLHNWSPLIRDFADTAALANQLDLVISVDTAIVHLVGAMGKPVWTLLPFAPDWRWFLDREDTPWYPTMRLFRQTERGDWDGVMRRVYDALKTFQL